MKIEWTWIVWWIAQTVETSDLQPTWVKHPFGIEEVFCLDEDACCKNKVCTNLPCKWRSKISTTRKMNCEN